MKNIILTFLLFTMIIAGHSPLVAQEKTDQVSGAVIVVAVEGQVNLLDQAGSKLDNGVSVGSVIPIGRFAVTEKGSKLTLLLSNGTIVTVQESTKMKVGTFDQEPFDSGGKKVSDLTEEPSTSKVTINLDLGSLVLKTKKLSKSSSLNIESPVGVAGIRGTEFQMGLQADGGMQLDVTESTVSFTPPGGQATMVTQGQGLDVSNTGAINARPVNPEVAQNIADTNEAATQASGDVSLDTVSDAMAESEPSGGNEDTPSENTDNESDSSEPKADEPAPASEAPSDSSPKVNMDEIIEQNSDAKQVRKTGEKAVSIDELAKFQFNAKALEKFLSMPKAVQDEFMGMNTDSVVRLMELQGFGQEEAIFFLQYSNEARGLILLLEDRPLLSLIDQQLDESLVLGAVTEQNIEKSLSANVPQAPASDPLEDDILELGEQMKEGGDAEVLDELLSTTGGEWTEESLDAASVSNLLSRDLSLDSEFTGVEILSEKEALDNSFYLQVSSLYQSMEDDQIIWGDQSEFIGGSTISMAGGDYNLPTSTSEVEGFVIGAEDSLSLSGSFSFSTESEKNVRVVMMSGDLLTMEDGSSLSSVLSEMVIAARGDVLLNNVQLQSAREVAIRSLRDVQLQNIELSASDRVRIMANRDLYVDGMVLSQNLPRLILEATTIRLRNIDFPSATQVQLNSLKGAIDGRYPNFGTSIPQIQQQGRVNFLENIRSGGNLLMDRASFDQFGGNINIGKLP